MANACFAFCGGKREEHGASSYLRRLCALSHLKDQLRKIRPKLAYMSRYSMFCIRIRSRQWIYGWATSDPALSGVPCLDRLSL